MSNLKTALQALAAQAKANKVHHLSEIQVQHLSKKCSS
jgi:hypothetical protein